MPYAIYGPVRGSSTLSAPGVLDAPCAPKARAASIRPSTQTSPGCHHRAFPFEIRANFDSLVLRDECSGSRTVSRPANLAPPYPQGLIDTQWPPDVRPMTSSDRDDRIKALVLHADDLGLCQAFNQGIRAAATRGCLTSTCVRVNGTAFEQAIRETLPCIEGIGLGVHLNLTEGRTTLKRVNKASPIHSGDGTYRLSYSQLLRRARSRSVLREIERDLRDQIEIALDRCGAMDHVNSHQHAHTVPAIFDLTCRLAREYEIPFVRIPCERPYAIRRLSYHLRTWYAENVVKFLVLRSMSQLHHRFADKHGIRTNDRFVGVLYSGYMTEETLEVGLERAADRGPDVVEALLHPCRLVATRDERYWTPTLRDYVMNPARQRELSAIVDKHLHEWLQREGWHLTNYRELADVSRRTPSQKPGSSHASSADSPLLRGKAIRIVLVIDANSHYNSDLVEAFLGRRREVEIVEALVLEPAKNPHSDLPGGEIVSFLRVAERLRFRRRDLARRLARLFSRTRERGRACSARSLLGAHGVRYRQHPDEEVGVIGEILAERDADVLVVSTTPPLWQVDLEGWRGHVIQRHLGLVPAGLSWIPTFHAMKRGNRFTGSLVTTGYSGGRTRVLERLHIPVFSKDTLMHLQELAHLTSMTAMLRLLTGTDRDWRRSDSPEWIPVEEAPKPPSSEEWRDFRAAGRRVI